MGDDIQRELTALRSLCTETNTILREHITEWKGRNQTIVSLEKDIWGDGTDSRPGIKIDVDRLKQVEATRTKVIWGIISTTVGLVITAIWKWIKP